MMRIGVDLGGNKIEIVALDDHGTAVIRRRTPTPSADYAATVRAIVDLVVQAQKEIGGVATVGIATPGAISVTTGLIKKFKQHGAEWQTVIARHRYRAGSTRQDRKRRELPGDFGSC